ncbi:MAG: hypothetical protein LC768_06840 [Acidobacteria bacterium]|nr:hypothetical protein [Acidobacteriota bacterium]MCA1638040.1 hypothetical protein [Acidobacteriota bacterium]
MKVFCFIFSVYLLVLSVQPCQDFAASEFSRPQIKNEQTRLYSNGENTESESHECSPFCICSCRQVSVTDTISVLSSNKKLAVFTKSAAQISYQNDYSHQPLNFIWQPPKFNFTA